jgi:hypothetical membrane protein
VKERAGATLQIAGVTSFVLAWSVLGAIRNGYNPLDDAISQLAELGAPNRELMTAGIVAFGAGSIAFAPSLGGRAGLALATAGVGSLGVAAFPCTEGCPGAGEVTDTGHAIAAGIHYVAFVLTPVLASRKRSAKIASIVAGAALAAHVLGVGPNGLMQRLGLTVLDAWIVGAAVDHLRSRASSRAASRA